MKNVMRWKENKVNEKNMLTFIKKRNDFTTLESAKWLTIIKQREYYICLYSYIWMSTKRSSYTTKKKKKRDNVYVLSKWFRAPICATYLYIQISFICTNQHIIIEIVWNITSQAKPVSIKGAVSLWHTINYLNFTKISQPFLISEQEGTCLLDQFIL